LPEEGFAGRWPDEIKMDDATKKRVDTIWRQLKMSSSKKK
jgi:3-polyprenyl-4-hydroxybenzoate decarboxylase